MVFTLLNIPLLTKAEATPAIEPSLSLPEAINIAGRQRMLSQRMVKFYCMLGMNIRPKESREKLQKARALFAHQIEQLQHIQYVDDRLGAAYKDNISLEWQSVQNLLQGMPTKERAVTLRQQADLLLAKSHHFVGQLEKLGHSHQGRLVNVSGRQRMLSQRISGMYMERIWGVANEQVKAQIEKSSLEFSSALTELSKAPENTKEIDDLLESVTGQWHVFTAINKLENKAYAQPTVVSDAADNILAMMNEVTGLYADL